jgi:uncharacterized membrane protein YhaH (DUF805 family)
LLFSFDGRINRAKFWLVALAANVVVLVLFGILMAATGMSIGPDGTPTMGSAGIVGGVIAAVLYIALLWIGLALGVKRYHDRNKSGWWVLIIFVPVIGGLWYLIEAGFLRGTVGPNQYGPDPLAS